MTFTSIAFLVFLPLVVLFYYWCPARFRWALLLFASCYFYMAFVPKYILVLLALILIDFFLAQAIEKATGTQKKAFLVLSIFSNVGILFVFKYFNFFNENVGSLAHFLGWNYSISALRLVLPLGLSFHTFQSLSYIIEVYRGKYHAERHLGVYALYVLFFPQLIAGPIERPQHLLPQLHRTARFTRINFESGVRLIAWGFFKKLVIADQLAVAVDYVYGHAGSATGLSVVLGLVFFAFQLYADFSGYTDIARGSARLLGIELVRNFEQPYFSKSIAEFWRRWHISLSSWFRDYFYFPLVYAARRGNIMWLYACIVATFLVTGLWHGAGWTFLCMGALFGCYIVGGLVTKKWRSIFVQKSGLARVPRAHAALQTLFTFALVCLAWVFFRSPSLEVALQLLGGLGRGWLMSPTQYLNAYVLQPFWTLGISRITLVLSVAFVVLLLCVEYTQQKTPLGMLFDRQPLLVRTFLYASLFFVIVLFGSFSTVPFLYFQF